VALLTCTGRQVVAWCKILLLDRRAEIRDNDDDEMKTAAA